MHYIIGDVHGEYQTLLALIEKLPKDAKLIFVGDLIDRGSKSKEVIAFVKEHKHQVVLGNHEDMMLEYGYNFLENFQRDGSFYSNNMWLQNGGIETLISYGLLEKNQDGFYSPINNKEKISEFKSDLEWIKELPLYIKLDTPHSSGKEVVISHSNLLKVWDIHNDKDEKERFKHSAIWSREVEYLLDLSPDYEGEVFNIYGHTPQPFKPKITRNYVNIDTGCCYTKYDKYGRLSAYCIESGEVVVQKNIKNLEG